MRVCEKNILNFVVSSNKDSEKNTFVNILESEALKLNFECGECID